MKATREIFIAVAETMVRQHKKLKHTDEELDWIIDDWMGLFAVNERFDRGRFVKYIKDRI